jgi:hypothetical protein
MEQPRKQNKPSTDLMRYVGWGTQLFVLLALSVYGGGKIDAAAGFRTPLLVWILPFLVLCGMIYQLIRDTSKKK